MKELNIPEEITLKTNRSWKRSRKQNYRAYKKDSRKIGPNEVQGIRMASEKSHRHTRQMTKRHEQTKQKTVQCHHKTQKQNDTSKGN